MLQYTCACRLRGFVWGLQPCASGKRMRVCAAMLRYTAHLADWSSDGRLCAYGAHNAVVLLDAVASRVTSCLTGHSSRCCSLQGNNLVFLVWLFLAAWSAQAAALGAPGRGRQEIGALLQAASAAISVLETHDRQIGASQKGPVLCAVQTISATP